VKDVVEGQPDMEVVGDLADCESLAVTAGRTRADVALVGCELSELSGAARQLFLDCEGEGITLLALTKDGRTAFRFELRPERVALTAEEGGVSPQVLVDAIRAAHQREAL
jgi:DNA-binding NarL/FixJ family response regulator